MLASQLGNQVAFAEFYTFTRGKVFSTTFRILRQKQSAEDVVQEVYARVWNYSQALDSIERYRRNNLAEHWTAASCLQPCRDLEECGRPQARSRCLFALTGFPYFII